MQQTDDLTLYQWSLVREGICPQCRLPLNDKEQKLCGHCQQTAKTECGENAKFYACDRCRIMYAL